MGIRQTLKRIPLVGSLARRLQRAWVTPPPSLEGSEQYWRQRYEAGGHSGDGSYNQLAEFKAEVLNGFVAEHRIRSVIEYGCGDGNQLSLVRYPRYIGFDVSPKAVAMCAERFAGDPTKTFRLMAAYNGETAELALSLDVIYHLIEDNVYTDHMNRLFDSATAYVAIYSSNTDSNPAGTAAHVRHRQFSLWVAKHRTEWTLLRHIPNRYPFQGDTKNGSCADFYFYGKIAPAQADRQPCPIPCPHE